MNARENIIDEICMELIKNDIDAREVKDTLYIIFDKYEIQERCTAVAELKEDRNGYLLKRFLIIKTVKGLSKKSIQVYRNTINFVLERIGKTVDDITADDIRLYLAIRQRKDKIKKVTADNELRCIRIFFRCLKEEELIQKDPTVRIERIKCERRKKEALTDEEVEKIRIAADTEMEKAIIEVLLSTGCRVSEMVNIRISDIESNKINVFGKGAKERYVYLNAKAKIAVELYLQKRKDINPYLFPGGNLAGILEKKFKRKEQKNWWKYPECVDKINPITTSTVESNMRKIAKRAGVERANPHKLRRTCATSALKRGMPIELVSRMLGHEQLSTTQIYLDLQESDLEYSHEKYVV